MHGANKDSIEYTASTLGSRHYKESLAKSFTKCYKVQKIDRTFVGRQIRAGWEVNDTKLCQRVTSLCLKIMTVAGQHNLAFKKWSSKMLLCELKNSTKMALGNFLGKALGKKWDFHNESLN